MLEKKFTASMEWAHATAYRYFTTVHECHLYPTHISVIFFFFFFELFIIYELRTIGIFSFYQFHQTHFVIWRKMGMFGIEYPHSFWFYVNVNAFDDIKMDI